MKLTFFCPSTFEIPKSFKSKTEVFGMGQNAAVSLVSKLEGLPAETKIVIFGSAGSLREDFYPGKVYAIECVDQFSLEKSFDYPIAKLSSSSSILKTPEQKKSYRKTTGADLVDLEMKFILERASENLRRRLILLRGVIDGANDDISFLEENSVNWIRLISPTKFLGFLRFVASWRLYIKAMEAALRHLETAFATDSSPNPEQNEHP